MRSSLRTRTTLTPLPAMALLRAMTLLLSATLFLAAPVASAQAAANTAQPLEYRGFYVQESGKPRFNLYDPATQKSTWVEQDETGQPITIRSYEIGRAHV